MTDVAHPLLWIAGQVCNDGFSDPRFCIKPRMMVRVAGMMARDVGTTDRRAPRPSGLRIKSSMTGVSVLSKFTTVPEISVPTQYVISCSKSMLVVSFKLSVTPLSRPLVAVTLPSSVSVRLISPLPRCLDLVQLQLPSCEFCLLHPLTLLFQDCRWLHYPRYV